MGFAQSQTSSLHAEGRTVELRGGISVSHWGLEQDLCPTELREIIHITLGSEKSRSIPEIFAGRYEVRINLLTQNECLHHHMQKLFFQGQKCPCLFTKCPFETSTRYSL